HMSVQPIPIVSIIDQIAALSPKDRQVLFAVLEGQGMLRSVGLSSDEYHKKEVGTLLFLLQSREKRHREQRRNGGGKKPDIDHIREVAAYRKTHSLADTARKFHRTPGAIRNLLLRAKQKRYI